MTRRKRGPNVIGYLFLWVGHRSLRVIVPCTLKKKKDKALVIEVMQVIKHSQNSCRSDIFVRLSYGEQTERRPMTSNNPNACQNISLMCE